MVMLRFANQINQVWLVRLDLFKENKFYDPSNMFDIYGEIWL